MLYVERYDLHCTDENFNKYKMKTVTLSSHQYKTLNWICQFECQFIDAMIKHKSLN